MTDSRPDDQYVAPPEPAPGTSVALVLIAVTQLMLVLDGAIANIALPYIGADLRIEEANLPWIFGGYALIFGALLLLGGRLGDIYGHRRMLVLGMGVFTVGSILGGVAGSQAAMFAGRALQAAGAAFAAPAALALIPITFPQDAARTRAYAVYAAMSGAGSGVGLILGGWLTGTEDLLGLELAGWRWTFLINVPVGIAVMLLAPRFLARTSTSAGHLDLPGAASATFGLLALVFGLTRAGEPQHGWTDGLTVVSLAVGVVLLVAFVVVELRVVHPLLPMRVLADRSRAASFIGMMLVTAAMFAIFYFLTRFMQEVLRLSPIETGVAFLPMSVGIVAGAALAARLTAMLSERAVSGAGTLLTAISLFMLSRLAIDDSAPGITSAVSDGVALGHVVNYWSDVFPYLVAMSLGVGLTFAGLTRTALARIPQQDVGAGSGTLNMAQQVGGAIGLAVLSTVAIAASGARERAVSSVVREAPGGDQGRVQEVLFQVGFTSGVTRAFLVAAGLMLLASLAIWTLVRPSTDGLTR